MQRDKMDYREHFDAVMRVMTSRGLLLAAYDASGRANAMTIGWGTLGSIWGMPLWIVLVRPSRYTHACIEHADCFAVNVPGHAKHDLLGHVLDGSSQVHVALVEFGL